MKFAPANAQPRDVIEDEPADPHPHLKIFHCNMSGSSTSMVLQLPHQPAR